MSLKRQRDEEELPTLSSKKSRNATEIKDLEKMIITSPINYNKIVDLLAMCKESNPETVHLGIHALVRVFCHLWRGGKLYCNEENESKKMVADWLKLKYAKLVKLLYATFAHPELALQVTALRSYFKLLEAETCIVDPDGDTPIFPNGSFINAVKAMLYSSEFCAGLSDEFCSKYLNVYDDVRYFFLKDAAKTIEQLPTDNSKRSTVRDNLLHILLTLNTMPTEEKEINTFWSTLIESKKAKSHAIHSFSSHKKVFQDCWLALLKLPMTNEQYKSLLLVVHKRIEPFMIKPQLLMDFLTESYNTGGVTSILALNGLFHLMQKYNLDYPNFYIKLYALFDRNLMHLRYRSRFFRLVELFLSSTHLPASIIASFLKRMSQLSLTAPPAAIISIIPLTYNLLKKHPTCMYMIHRPNNLEWKDLFNPGEKDPAKTGALSSSLWELAALQNHFNPHVATLSKLLSEPFTKPSYNLEDFLDHSYSSMFEAESKRKINEPPAVEFRPPGTIFMHHDERPGEWLSSWKFVEV